MTKWLTDTALENAPTTAQNEIGPALKFIASSTEQKIMQQHCEQLT